MIDVTCERVISLKDAAKRLGVTLKTVYLWSSSERQPRLETAKFGGKRVTSLEALQRFSQQDDPALALAGAGINREREARREAQRRRHGI